jgi:hypothetical protein
MKAAVDACATRTSPEINLRYKAFSGGTLGTLSLVKIFFNDI